MKPNKKVVKKVRAWAIVDTDGRIYNELSEELEIYPTKRLAKEKEQPDWGDKMVEVLITYSLPPKRTIKK